MNALLSIRPYTIIPNPAIFTLTQNDTNYPQEIHKAYCINAFSYTVNTVNNFHKVMDFHCIAYAFHLLFQVQCLFELSYLNLVYIPNAVLYSFVKSSP